jgi:steroid delta-isomerase-like uncharacterized protein
MSDTDLKNIASRWFDAINTGNTGILDQIVAYDVLDHSGLSSGHGFGLDGHKKLSQNFRKVFPQWKTSIDNMTVYGDMVMIDFSGSAPAPAGLNALVGSSAGQNPASRTVDFKMKACVRIQNGKIVEHWAMEGPFGQKSAPDEVPVPGTGTGTGTGAPVSSTDDNKQLLQKYVKNVIDGQNPSLASYYFAPNFYNHDRAPGEEPGLQGVTAFLGAIFSAFSGFQTTIAEQIAQDDLVVGRWTQSFKNTGPYLSFPASGKDIHIAGITITRVRDGKIVEEWEARDAVSLLVQMGVVQPLGPLDGGSAADSQQTMNEAVASQFFYEGWNPNNPDVIDQIVAPHFTNNNLLAGQKDGPEGLKQFVQAWHSAFPDMNVAIDLLISEGTKVAVRWTLNGTHQGTFLGIPATGKYVSLPGITIFRIEDGTIKEGWGFWEQAGMLQQLGVVQFPQYPGGAPAGGGPTPGTPGGAGTPPATPGQPNW